MRQFILAICLIINVSVQSQSNDEKKLRADVEEMMMREDFASATKPLAELLAIYPEEAGLNLDQGVCCLNLDGMEKDAIRYLEKAVEKYPLTKSHNTEAIESRFYLGQAYHVNSMFDKALEIFESLKAKIPAKQKDLLTSIDKEIRYNQNALVLKSKPVRFKVSPLENSVNSPYDEHSPVVSADETVLIFTSNREGTGNLQTLDGLFYEDLYISQLRFNKWSDAENMGPIINTDGNNASVSLSADGKSLIIYQHDGISGDLYQSDLTLNGWTKPEKLPKPINSQYSETHASYSVDGSTIFFSSDRPGGFGGKDIYMSRMLPDGSWGRVINLGPAINTTGDEESPFIHSNSKTLYFCSTEHNSMGGYDIFKSELKDSIEWGKPENIGFPINTPDDDLFFIPTADEQRVYFASRRMGGEGRSDIYLIEFDENDPRSLCVVAGFVFDSQKRPYGNVNISVVDKQSGEHIGYYRPNPLTGKYVVIVPAGKEYQLTYVSENDTVVRDIVIPGRANYSSASWAVYMEPLFVGAPDLKP